MKLDRAYAALVLACSIALGPWPAARAGAQTGVSQVVEIDTVTCADVLASPGDRADKLLIFFDGYMKGTSHQTVWDERAEGELINRVMAECAVKTLADESGRVVRGRAVRSGRQAEGSP